MVGSPARRQIPWIYSISVGINRGYDEVAKAIKTLDIDEIEYISNPGGVEIQLRGYIEENEL